MKQIKVSLNELLSMAGYYVEKTIVPPYKELEQSFCSIWKEVYLDESLRDDEGKKCFIVKDVYSSKIRAIVVRSAFDMKTRLLLLDIMDNYIYDLIYWDCQQCISRTYLRELDGSYISLLRYIKEHKKELNNKISDFMYSYLLILADYRLDLLKL